MTHRPELATIRPDWPDDRAPLVYGVVTMTQRSRLPPPVSDPLSEILHSLHLTGALYCIARLGEPWGIDIPQLDGHMTLQIVTTGQCWIEVKDFAPRLLGPGSMTLIPHGTAHRMRSSPQASTDPLFDLPVEPISDRFETLHHGGDGPPCTVAYGVLQFDSVAAHRLMTVLPPLIHVDTWEADATGWLHATLRLIASEARQLGPGAEIIITRLADVLVIQAIRSWLEHAAIPDQGWIAAFNDEHIGRALAKIHQCPATPWSVADLAAEAAMSRSTFSARFTALVGDSAMSYVESWRMQLARTQLQTTANTVASIAHNLGYHSEATFSRAYKRAFEISPSGDRVPPTTHPLPTSPATTSSQAMIDKL